MKEEMKMKLALILAVLPTIAFGQDITVTSLDSNSVTVAPIMQPFSKDCNTSIVEEYYGRKAINEDHAKIMCKMYKAATDTNIAVYEVTETNSTPDYKREPKLGMSKVAIENSTWGEPKRKTVTETEYSTVEYWFYDQGMIVFENYEVRSITKDE